MKQHGVQLDQAHLWSFLSEAENRQAVATAGPPPAKKKDADVEDDNDEDEELMQWKLGVGPVDNSGVPLLGKGTQSASALDMLFVHLPLACCFHVTVLVLLSFVSTSLAFACRCFCSLLCPFCPLSQLLYHHLSFSTATCRAVAVSSESGKGTSVTWSMCHESPCRFRSFTLAGQAEQAAGSRGLARSCQQGKKACHKSWRIFLQCMEHKARIADTAVCFAQVTSRMWTLSQGSHLPHANQMTPLT